MDDESTPAMPHHHQHQSDALDVEQDELEQFLSRLLATRGKGNLVQFIRQLTTRECRFIREVSYNILFNSSMALTDTARQYFRRNITNLRLLGSIRICAGEKRTILNGNHPLLKRMAAEALRYLSKA